MECFLSSLAVLLLMKNSQLDTLILSQRGVRKVNTPVTTEYGQFHRKALIL